MNEYLKSENLPADFKYPDEYIAFVNTQKLKNGSFNNMPPWVFAGNELWALDESEQLFGVKLVPFAQAENQDKMAYFCTHKNNEVWEANPWEGCILKKHKDFSSWLSQAKIQSDHFVASNPQYNNREFWCGIA